MAEVARVHNLEALKNLKLALWRFQEIVNVALTDAESDMQRTSIWLETEQRTYWVAEQRKRHEAVEKAKQAVREKQLYKDATGQRSSAVDEMKLLQAAQRRLVEAEQKVAAVKKYIPKMQKETQMYRGGVQRFASTVQSDLPIAVDKLDQMLAKLEAYVSLGAGGPPELATSTAADFGRASAEPSGGMARPADAPVATGPQIPANFPKFDAPQVALTYVEQTTGEPRNADGSVPPDGASTFVVFPTAEDARAATRPSELQPTRAYNATSTTGTATCCTWSNTATRRRLQSRTSSETRRRPVRDREREARDNTMGVYEARGQLSKAMKDLILRWNEAKMDWDDAAARAFETNVLEPLQRDAKNAASAMDSAAEVLAQVRRECE